MLRIQDRASTFQKVYLGGNVSWEVPNVQIKDNSNKIFIAHGSLSV